MKVYKYCDEGKLFQCSCHPFVLWLRDTLKNVMMITITAVVTTNDEQSIWAFVSWICFFLFVVFTLFVGTAIYVVINEGVNVLLSDGIVISSFLDLLWALPQHITEITKMGSWIVIVMTMYAHSQKSVWFVLPYVVLTVMVSF